MVSFQRTLVDSKQFKRNLRSSNGHWEKMDVTKQVRHWFQKPERNYGLMVRVEYRGENLANMPTSHTIQGENVSAGCHLFRNWLLIRESCSIHTSMQTMVAAVTVYLFLLFSANVFGHSDQGWSEDSTKTISEIGLSREG